MLWHEWEFLTLFLKPRSLVRNPRTWPAFQLEETGYKSETQATVLGLSQCPCSGGQYFQKTQDLSGQICDAEFFELWNKTKLCSSIIVWNRKMLVFPEMLLLMICSYLYIKFYVDTSYLQSKAASEKVKVSSSDVRCGSWCGNWKVAKLKNITTYRSLEDLKICQSVWVGIFMLQSLTYRLACVC